MDRPQIHELFEATREALGDAELLSEIENALSTDQLEDILDYIRRMNDLDNEE